MTPALPAALTLVLVVGLVASEHAASPVAKAVFKPLASLGFLATGVAAGLLSMGPIGTVVFAGLLLGALGDVLLLSRDKRFFLAGLVSFLLNHVAYVIAFALWGIDPLWAAVAAVPLGVFGLGVWRWVGAHTGRLRGPVIAYILVISTMVAAAVGSRPNAWVVAGAVSFFLSDLAVARDRFLSPGPANKTVGLPLYYVGQVLFAWGATLVE